MLMESGEVVQLLTSALVLGPMAPPGGPVWPESMCVGGQSSEVMENVITGACTGNRLHNQPRVVGDLMKVWPDHKDHQVEDCRWSSCLWPHNKSP